MRASFANYTGNFASLCITFLILNIIIGLAK